MRKAIVSGSFYPSAKKGLGEEIKKSFLHNFGAGRMPKADKKGSSNLVYGVIVPHAGYVYSGPCASHAYNALANSEMPDTFVILGTNHTGYAESSFALSKEDFETPLGTAKNDSEFYNLLVSEGKKYYAGDTQGDKAAHNHEHSIEVQLPFLQFIFGNEFKILPIICNSNDYGKYESFAEFLIASAKKLKKKICIIASSDFTHYGFSYNFVPFVGNVKENLYKLDRNAIDLILKFDTKEFLNYSGKTTICGAGAITLATEACRILGSKKAELLKYYTSGDITGDYGSAVGYASIVFR